VALPKPAQIPTWPQSGLGGALGELGCAQADPWPSSQGAMAMARILKAKNHNKIKKIERRSKALQNKSQAA